MVDNDKYGTLFCKINGFSPRSIGAPTPTPSSLTPIDSPRQDVPVDMTTSFGCLKPTTILMDQMAGEEMNFILFYLPSYITSAFSGGETYLLSSSLVLP